MRKLVEDSMPAVMAEQRPEPPGGLQSTYSPLPGRPSSNPVTVKEVSFKGCAHHSDIGMML